MVLRWFAGGSSYRISLNHGVHYQEIMKSAWIVVDLVNLCKELKCGKEKLIAGYETLTCAFYCRRALLVNLLTLKEYSLFLFVCTISNIEMFGRYRRYLLF